MRIPQTKDQKIKSFTHFAQAFFIFIAGCLSLAVLTKDGSTGAQIGYYFALCFFSVVALIYQVMVPMWSRAWRFANVYAYAAIDFLFTLLWFAAFVAVAQWNSAGLKKGADDSKDAAGKGTCAKFAYGSASKCETTKAAIGFGVVICGLFVATSVFSVQGVMKYKRTGVLPGAEHRPGQHGGKTENMAFDEANKDAWSTNTDDVNPSYPSNPFEDRHEETTYGQADRQGLLRLQHEDDGMARRESQPEDGLHHGRSMSYDSDHQSHVEYPAGIYDETRAPTALNPAGYERSTSPNDRLTFPQGNYSAS